MVNSSANSFSFNLTQDKLHHTIAFVILSFSSALFNAIAIVLLLPILFSSFNNNLNNFADNNLSLLVKWCFILNSLLNEEYGLLILITSFFCAIGLGFFFAYISSIYNLIRTKKIVLETKNIVFTALAGTNLNYFYNSKTENILFQINQEIDKAVLAIKSRQKILVNLIIILFLTTILLLISLQLTLVAAGLLGLVFTIKTLLRDRLKKQEALLLEKSRLYNRKTIDFLTGIKHIKSSANEQQEVQNIIQAVRIKHQAELKVKALAFVIKPIEEVLKAMIVIILSTSAYYLYSKQLQLLFPILLIYLLILFQLLPIIEQLNNSHFQYINNKFSIESINHFLSDIQKITAQLGDHTFTGFKDKINLHNLTFAYPHHAQIVLDKINLNIYKGTTVALVGSSGAGKSTLASLLLRLYEPIEGRITIDNQNITEYSISSLRKSIAVIDSEPFLFNESILYNLTYGLDNVNEFQVMAAAKITKAYNFILKLYDGFDSKIGDKKTVISESERQLIAITRALLINPEIVILDEPLKNIGKSDRDTVQKAINELCHHRTNIIITNLLATIKNADQIVVLNKGKIIESGTHHKLLKNGNLYKRMYAIQFKNSQQSHQQLLARKISKKLANQANSTLSYDINNNFNVLLNYLHLVDQSLAEDNLEQEKMLDESFQSAKNMLASLRDYRRKISEGFKKDR